MIDRNDIEFIRDELDIYIQKSKIKLDFNILSAEVDKQEIRTELENELIEKTKEKKETFEEALSRMINKLDTKEDELRISALIDKSYFSKLKNKFKKPDKYRIVSLGLAIIGRNLNDIKLQIGNEFDSEADAQSKVEELKKKDFDAEINSVNDSEKFIVTIPGGQYSGNIMHKLRKADIDYLPNYKETPLEKSPTEIIDELSKLFDEKDFILRNDIEADISIKFCLERHFCEIMDIDDLIFESSERLSGILLEGKRIDTKIEMINSLLEQILSECKEKEIKEKFKLKLDSIKSKYKRIFINNLFVDAEENFKKSCESFNKHNTEEKLETLNSWLKETYFKKYTQKRMEEIKPLINEICSEYKSNCEGK
jgi:hypothetical protein